jgi:hypothetical protein
MMEGINKGESPYPADLKQEIMRVRSKALADGADPDEAVREYNVRMEENIKREKMLEETAEEIQKGLEGGMQ